MSMAFSKPAISVAGGDAGHRYEGAATGKKGLLGVLGPGLITGASDDDPSGIATYSQAGAQFGYGLLWTLLFSYPLMTAIQEISALIGRVTGHGIAGNMRKYYPRWLLFAVVALVFTANTFNIGADIQAMGAALNLLMGGPILLYAIVFGVGSLLLQVFIPYHRYARILKWLTLALLAYVATIFAVHVPWRTALRDTVVPRFAWTRDAITMLVAVLGTTISPYLFFWQASQEAEDEDLNPDEQPLKVAPEQAPAQIARIRVDTYVGMAVSNVIAFFIMVTTAATLHAHGTTNIQTAAQAAEALRPLAGRFAFALFALGIIGTGLLSVPVLGGSAAYAAGEAMHWRIGLEHKPRRAKKFYGVLAFATVVGIALNLLHFNPIKALFWSAVLNGVVSGPIMAVMMVMSCNAKVMGQFTLTRRQRILGWLSTAVMLACAAAMFAV
jgi:NRAMP (natural resistance-associated macrophage protein)-like metal ion transporter